MAVLDKVVQSDYYRTRHCNHCWVLRSAVIKKADAPRGKV